MKLFFTSLPVNEFNIPTTLQRFRYGADYAISSNTDTYAANVEEMEFLSMKYSVRGTVFEQSQTSLVSRDVYTQNTLEESIYWLTNNYHNGTSIVAIPDYTAATWSSAGVAAFPNAILGAPKPLQYPNIGTQMMYMSSGLIGVQLSVAFTDWDKGIGNEGVFNPVVDPQKSDVATITSTGTNGDGFPSDYFNTSPNKAGSYSSGQQGTWQVYANHGITWRNSSAGGNVPDTYFDEWDITQRSELTYPSSVRYTDGVSMSGTFPERVIWISDKITTVSIPGGGWFRNFTHWHTATVSDMELLYIELKNISDTEVEEAWFAGVSEATEYSWFRNMVTGINAVQSGANVTVTVTIDNVFNLDLTHIITPISIEVDLSKTVLTGLDIVSDVGRVRSLGNDIYIVDVYADSLETVLTFGTADYISLDYPAVTLQTFNSGTLIINTDLLTVATLFSDQNGTVVERKNSNATAHTFNGLASGTTFYLAIMTRENKSIIKTINT